MSTSWPTNPTVNNLNLPSSPSLEPSGLTFVTDSDGTVWLFVASDNGYLTRGSLDTSSPPVVTWNTAHSFQPKKNKLGDYESVTSTGPNQMMVGIEGDAANDKNDPTEPSVPYPIIARFDITYTSDGNDIGDFTGSQWTLSDFTNPSGKANKGMEGLTFVPNGSYPTSWLLNSPRNPNQEPNYRPHYGGLFFTATQASPATIFVYDLGAGSGDSHSVASFETLYTMNSDGFPLNLDGSSVSNGPSGQLQISDLFFDQTSRVLYVLYDGDSGNDYLQALVLGTSDGTFSQLWAVQTPFQGCEGLAVSGDDLYLAVDLSSHQTGVAPLSQDGVYQFPGFISTMNSQVNTR